MGAEYRRRYRRAGGEGNTYFYANFKALGELEVKPHLIVEINDFSRVPESVAFLEGLGLGV